MLWVLAFILAISVLLFLSTWKRDWASLTIALVILGIAALVAFLIHREEK